MPWGGNRTWNQFNIDTLERMSISDESEVNILWTSFVVNTLINSLSYTPKNINILKEICIILDCKLHWYPYI